MRLALISTPRSGNTWLRHMLAGLYGLNQYAVHDPSDLDWPRLPDDCIVQLHWRRNEAFVRWLKNLGFRFVTIGRHPLDVLISILHFCTREPDTRRWLLGEGGDESAICGLSPSAPEFASYAVGARAKALLSVTPEWWSSADSVCVRYEDLVEEPAATLEATGERLGSFNQRISETIEALAFEKLQLTSQNGHFWQGRPGLWQELLPAAAAAPIALAHAPTIAALGYSSERQVQPSPQTAAARWERLV
jgi:hypothetical protein